MEKWKALENKADFISTHLNKLPTPKYIENSEQRGSAEGLPDFRIQLENLGYVYDPTNKKAFDPSMGDYVSFRVVNGKVEL